MQELDPGLATDLDRYLLNDHCQTLQDLPEFINFLTISARKNADFFSTLANTFLRHLETFS
jgi:hypothetical protein